MSRAFVKEPDGSEPIELPEREIGEERNLVTQHGYDQIVSEIARLQKDMSVAQSQDDKMAVAIAVRDLNYWSQRLATAEIIPVPNNTKEIKFGHTVTIEYSDGRQRSFQIVGIDEANPSEGLLSYISPLAVGLIGKTIGDVVEFGQHEAEITAIK